MSILIHVPQQKQLQDDTFSELGCIKGHQKMNFVSEIFSNSSFLYEQIFHQNGSNCDIDIIKSQKIPYYQVQNEHNDNSYIGYNQYIDEHLINKNLLTHQRVPNSQLCIAKNPQYHQFSFETCSNTAQEITTRHKFTKEEDEMLIKMVNTYGAKKWSRIASMIPGRTPRQCRDRYANYLAPGFKNGEWSHCEDILLAEKFTEYGSQWTLISHFFQGRTPNSIKNRWKYNVSRRAESLITNNSPNVENTESSKIFNNSEFLNDRNHHNMATLQSKFNHKTNRTDFEIENQSLPSLRANNQITSYFPTKIKENQLVVPFLNVPQCIHSKDNLIKQNEKIEKFEQIDEKGKSSLQNPEFLCRFENKFDEDEDDNWTLSYFDDDEQFNGVSIFS